MPSIDDLAICVRRWEFSETSQTASLLTRRHGIIRGLAKGARREKGSFSGGLDLLVLGQLGAIVRHGRELATLTRWQVERTFPALRRSLAANRAGWYLADLVHTMLRDQDPHPRTFDALVEALGGLDAPDANARRLLEFQWILLDDAGYRPELDVDVQTRQALPERGATLGFDAYHGGTVADTGAAGAWRVRRATIEVLRGLAAGEAPEQATPETITRAGALLAAYIRETLGAELPSLRGAYPGLKRGGKGRK